MARGGKRQGRTGASYPNRADLQQGPRISDVGPQKTYGERTAREDQVRAVQQSGALQPGFTPAAPASPVDPVALLDAPTQNDRPVTHGLPTGPGAGPEVLGIADLPSEVLRAVYLQDPREEIRELLEVLHERGM